MPDSQEIETFSLAVYSAQNLEGGEAAPAEWLSSETLDTLGKVFLGHELAGEAQNSEGCVVFTGRETGEMSIVFRLPEATLGVTGAEYMVRLALSHIPETAKFEIQVDDNEIIGQP